MPHMNWLPISNRIEVNSIINNCAEFIRRYSIRYDINSEEMDAIADNIGFVSLAYLSDGSLPDINNCFVKSDWMNIHSKNIIKFLQHELDYKLIRKLKHDIVIYTLPKPYDMCNLTIKNSDIYLITYAFIKAYYNTIVPFKKYIQYTKK